MRPRLVPHAVLALLLLSGGMAPTSAQQPASGQPGVQHRNNCRLAAQVVSTGHPHTKRDWARNYLVTCEAEVPPLVVDLWRSVPADTAEVRWLNAISRSVRDRRIYDRVREVALDPSRPDVVRVGAMVVLTKYADPDSDFSIAVLEPPAEPVRRIRPIWVGTTFSSQLRGPEPMDECLLEPVHALFEQIAQAESSGPVWYAAASLARSFAIRIGVGGCEIPPR